MSRNYMIRSQESWEDFCFEKGTSGDQVFIILKDWKLERLITLRALKVAYKFWMEDEEIGYQEAGDIISNALAEIMGDEEFIIWNENGRMLK